MGKGDGLDGLRTAILALYIVVGVVVPITVPLIWDEKGDIILLILGVMYFGSLIALGDFLF